MKVVKLPNGFVLDLDSIHYIGSENPIKHPFSKMQTGEVSLLLYGEGNTKVEMVVTSEQSREIQRVFLNRQSQSVKLCKFKNFIKSLFSHEN